MFARILEFVPKHEKKDEFIKVMKNDVLPILKKQTGFLEILPFVPDHLASVCRGDYSLRAF
jgi:quinol monooxygenase YgiN